MSLPMLHKDHPPSFIDLKFTFDSTCSCLVFFFHVFPGFEETPAELHSAVRKRNWQAFLKMMLASNCRRWRMKPCACVVLCFSIVRGMQMSKKQEHFSSLKIKKDSVLVFQMGLEWYFKKTLLLHFFKLSFLCCGRLWLLNLSCEGCTLLNFFFSQAVINNFHGHFQSLMFFYLITVASTTYAQASAGLIHIVPTVRV